MSMMRVVIINDIIETKELLKSLEESIKENDMEDIKSSVIFLKENLEKIHKNVNKLDCY